MLRHTLTSSLVAMTLLCSILTDGFSQPPVRYVYLQKVSDAIEGGMNGLYKVGLHYPVPVGNDIVVQFALSGTAQATPGPGTDFNLVGLNAGNIVIPAGATEVFVEVDAGNDGIIEGPESVDLQLLAAISAGQNIPVDAGNRSARVGIIDANAASTTPIQVLKGTDFSEPAGQTTFTVKLAGVATSAWPVVIGYRLDGNARPGVDFQAFGEIVIPPNTNAVSIFLNATDDHIIEGQETISFRLLSGSATDGGGNAFIFPPDPANDNINVSLADDDYVPANAVVNLVKISDAAEPAAPGIIRISLPGDYVAASVVSANIQFSGSATPGGTDYIASPAVLPAYHIFGDIYLNVVDDTLYENTETAVCTLLGASDSNLFQYTAAPAQNTVGVDIADDDTNLPLRLIGFAGNMQDNGAASLRWTTAEEENTAYFEVLRSRDGRGFEKIGVVPASGSGNHNYAYTDGAPGPVNFYRLHMVDQDGSSTYSRMIKIGWNQPAPVVAFPNPARNYLTVDLGNRRPLPNGAKVIDSSGKVRKELRLTGGRQQIPIDDLLPGFYFLSVESGETFKFVVAR